VRDAWCLHSPRTLPRHWQGAQGPLDRLYGSNKSYKVGGEAFHGCSAQTEAVGAIREPPR
jgi:hypothetical protein